MPAAQVFNIESGKLALSMVGDDDPKDWQAPGGKTLATVTLADYAASGINFSCQVTSGAINASPNTTPKTTPATFCEPEVTTTQVGVTSFTLDTTILQDPHVKAGISRFLFENDTHLAYFYLGLSNEDPPKAIGQARIIAGSFGGDARTDLTATLSLPVEVKPDIEFGIEGDSAIVTGGGTAGVIHATGANATTTGDGWTPVGSVPPANLTALQNSVPAIVASPTTAWTTGQKVTLGDASSAHWSGSAWVSGAA